MGFKRRVPTAPFDEAVEVLLARIRREFGGRPVVVEKRMFGGVAFLVRGHMSCGVTREGNLMVRVGAQAYDYALAQPHARPMDFTGRPLTGFVYVGPEGVATDAGLRRWVFMGFEFAASLPPKT
jgi:hypothetical protein